MRSWFVLAVVFGGALAFLVFKLGEKAETFNSSRKRALKAKEEVAKEKMKTQKMVELRFSDGSKLVLDENSPYYQDFLDYADKILSKEEKNA